MKPYFSKTVSVGLFVLLIQSPFLLAQNALNALLQDYRSHATQDFSAQRGEQAWQSQHPAANGPERSCTMCHHKDIRQPGRHIRTKKVIQPMAKSANPKRYTDVKKIRKWFKRNCKWTWGRECTAQEKGDILTYLSGQ